MNRLSQFSVDVAPKLIMIDANGSRHPVASAELAYSALMSAEMMKDASGAGKTRSFVEVTNETTEPFLLYYRSDRGQPKKAEIARAAKVIARSEVTLLDDQGHYGDEDLRVTGNRALVYPERPGAVTGAVPFLISKRIFFNRNRSTLAFPYVDDDFSEELDAVIEDINGRLLEGSVSAPR